ncbi:uncharacterized protein LOC134214512 [Armigeres subalbatus]|uniref:uncharacterized protein LOC134214512 n=1 Tax=Armigeres subalbatus TaxID=124917 RepID=UPI002ED249EA
MSSVHLSHILSVSELLVQPVRRRASRVKCAVLIPSSCVYFPCDCVAIIKKIAYWGSASPFDPKLFRFFVPFSFILGFPNSPPGGTMFRHHMTQYGSCASEVHKTLCYFFAALNIFLALDMLADFSAVWFDALDDSGDRYNDAISVQSYKMLMCLVIAGPAIANICLAVMLIVGVYKRRPTYIRVFRMFIMAQVIVICFLALFSYTIVLEHRGSHTIMLFVLVISIALFGAEAWIAGDYHKLLLDEMQLEDSDSVGIA